MTSPIPSPSHSPSHITLTTPRSHPTLNLTAAHHVRGGLAFRTRLQRCVGVMGEWEIGVGGWWGKDCWSVAEWEGLGVSDLAAGGAGW